MKLSVVAPVLNEEFFLPLYLESVLVYADEVIFLDGGSTDRTIEIIKFFQEKCRNLKLFRQPQEGVPYSDDWNEGARRNFLIDAATGDWILALDADEIMDDSFALRKEELLSRPQVDAYGFALVSFWQNPFTIRVNVPGDPHWQTTKYALFRNNKRIRYAGRRHHPILLYDGKPFWEAKERLAEYPEIKLYHYHYALGPRIKFNDNRRGDVNRLNNMGEPDWTFTPPNYAIKTMPFTGNHPRVIQRFLAEAPALFWAGEKIPRLDLTCLSFDRYQLFQTLANMVNALGQKGLRILHIGLVDADFSMFVPEQQVTWLDKSASLGVPLLPFPDQSFDVVLAVDVCGAMASGQREGFVREVVRVADKKAIITTPHAEALPAIELIYQLIQNPYLKPHLERGLPTAEEMEAVVAKLALPYRRFPHSSLASWMGMLLAAHFLTDDAGRALNRFFNQNFALLENRYPCYRLIYEIQIQTP